MASLLDLDGFVVLTAPVLAIGLVVARVRWRVSARSAALTVVFYVYVAFVIKYTLLPLYIGGTPAGVGMDSVLPNANFVPGRGFTLTGRQTVGNVALGVPFGMIMPLLVRRLAPPRRALLACAAFGLIVEALQFVLGALALVIVRHLDVNDVVLNFLGAAIGYGWLRFALALLHWSRGEPSPPSGSDPTDPDGVQRPAPAPAGG